MKHLVKNRGNLRLAIALAAAALAAAACVAPPARRGPEYAPPPRSPAPGYHQLYRGHDIRYDANLGVYVVLDLPNHYFYNDHYYRFHSGHWYYSRDLDEHWRRYDERKLPPGLAKKYRREDKDWHRGRDDD